MMSEKRALMVSVECPKCQRRQQKEMLLLEGTGNIPKNEVSCSNCGADFIAYGTIEVWGEAKEERDE